jgi:hypothetical protein
MTKVDLLVSYGKVNFFKIEHKNYDFLAVVRKETIIKNLLDKIPLVIWIRIEEHPCLRFQQDKELEEV